MCNFGIFQCFRALARDEVIGSLPTARSNECDLLISTYITTQNQIGTASVSNYVSIERLGKFRIHSRLTERITPN